MYRFSVWICVSLLVYGYSAKPYKSRGKASWTAVQETLMSDEMGKMQPSDLGQKPVEAPEDLDLTDYSFSDSWKNIRAEKGDKERQVETVEIEKGQGRYSTAEEDMDDINHPSQLQLEDTFAEVVDTQQPEQDLEKLYHPEIKEDKDQFELFAPGTEFRGQLEPEEDRDHIYHGDLTKPIRGGWMDQERKPLFHWPSQSIQGQVNVPNQFKFSNLGAEFKGQREPEEDRDHIYHGDLPEPIRGGWMDQERKPLVDWPSQRIHSQPEEDRDKLYHPK